jgi:hypothetical protein
MSEQSDRQLRSHKIEQSTQLVDVSYTTIKPVQQQQLLRQQQQLQQQTSTTTVTDTSVDDDNRDNDNRSDDEVPDTNNPANETNNDDTENNTDSDTDSDADTNNTEQDNTDDMAQSSSLLAPDLFRGTRMEDAQDWLNSVKLWLAFKSYNNAQSCAALPVLLRESALCWFHALPDATKQDFNALSTAFLDRYKTTGITGWQDSATLWRTKQQEAQSVDDYINKMEKLCSKTTVSDEQKRFAIITGLKPSIRAQVLQHQIDTTDDIRKWATVAEASQIQDDSSTDVATALKQLQSQIARLELQSLNTRSRSASPAKVVRFADGDTYDTQPSVAVFNSQSRQGRFLGQRRSTSTQYTDRVQTPDNGTTYRRWDNQQQYTNSSPSFQTSWRGTQAPRYPQQQQQQQCYFCSGKRHVNRQACPAFNATCRSCSKVGHFASTCRSLRRNNY